MPRFGIIRLGLVLITAPLVSLVLPESSWSEEAFHPDGDAGRRGRADEAKSQERRDEDAISKSREGWRGQDLTNRPKSEFHDGNTLSKAMEDARIKATLERIDKGVSDPHRNDGSEFKNIEGRLPKKGDGYYKEYVSRESDAAPVGKERIVIGKEGEVYWSNDHYETFRRVK